jgi:hypothetical protein
MRQPGIDLRRELLLATAWGEPHNGGARTVDVHTRWLRMKIEADPSGPEPIATACGGGYRFEGQGGWLLPWRVLTANRRQQIGRRRCPDVAWFRPCRRTCALTNAYSRLKRP